MDYWQVVRRPADGGHQSIADYRDLDAAKARRDQMNADYQTDEYRVIHRTGDGFVRSLGVWWEGRKFPAEEQMRGGNPHA